jgi:Fe-S cluster assembly ATPase SufC
MLAIKHFTFCFSPEKQILKDLTLSLEENIIYAFIGENDKKQNLSSESYRIQISKITR